MAGNSSRMVSLFQNATAKHAPLPMAAPQLRRGRRPAPGQPAPRPWPGCPARPSGGTRCPAGCPVQHDGQRERPLDPDPSGQRIQQEAPDQARHPHELAADHDRAGVAGEPVGQPGPGRDGGPAQERVIPVVGVVGQVVGGEHAPPAVDVGALVVVGPAGIPLQVPGHGRAHDHQRAGQQRALLEIPGDPGWPDRRRDIWRDRPDRGRFGSGGDGIGVDHAAHRWARGGSAAGARCSFIRAVCTSPCPGAGT